MVIVAILTLIVVQSVMVHYLPIKYITGYSIGDILKFALNPLVILAYGLMIIPLWWSGHLLYQTFQQRYWEYSITLSVITQLLAVGIGYAVTRQPLTFREIIAIVMVLCAAWLIKS